MVAVVVLWKVIWGLKGWGRKAEGGRGRQSGMVRGREGRPPAARSGIEQHMSRWPMVGGEQPTQAEQIGIIWNGQGWG